MNKSKNQIEKILQFKARSKGNKTWNQKVTTYFKTFLELDKYLVEPKKMRPRSKEIGSRYFHINNVAFIQEIFKLFVKDLVDVNHEHARRLCHKYPLKIEIEHVSHVLLKRISLGEFIASQYQPNNIDELSSFYSTILNEDFYKAFKGILEDDQRDHPLNLTKELAIKMLKETFEKRHIVAHELNPIEKVSMEDYFNYMWVMVNLYNLLLIRAGKRKGALVPNIGPKKDTIS